VRHVDRPGEAGADDAEKFQIVRVQDVKAAVDNVVDRYVGEVDFLGPGRDRFDRYLLFLQLLRLCRQRRGDDGSGSHKKLSSTTHGDLQQPVDREDPLH